MKPHNRFLFEKTPELRPYQQAAVDKIVANGGKGIVAHATGSGKTYTALAAVEQLIEKGTVKTVLVILPPSLRPQFVKDGIENFTQHKATIVVSDASTVPGTKPISSPGSSPYYVISYDLLRLEGAGKVYSALKPDIVIADEVHKARNMVTGTYRSLAELRTKVPRFIGLTASLLSNSPADIAALLNLATGQTIDPKKLGTKLFKTQVVYKNKFFNREPGKREIVGIKSTRAAKDLVKYLHVVDKDEVSQEMPAVEREIATVEMTPEQRRQYDYVMGQLDPVTRHKITKGLPLGQKELSFIFAKITRARQVSNATHVIDASKTPSQAAQDTPKVKQLLNDVESHIKTTPDAKVIIYTHFVVGGLDVVSAGLQQRGIPFVAFSGKDSPQARIAASNAFRNGTTKVIVLTPAGEHGLNFPDTTFVAVMDGHFNPERVTQAEARGIRLGGQSHRPKDKRKVMVKNYHTVFPQTWLQKLVGKRDRSVDQWISQVAAKKETTNKSVKNIFKTAQGLKESKDISATDILTKKELGLAAGASALGGSVVGGTVGYVRGRVDAKKMGLQGKERKKFIRSKTLKGAAIGGVVTPIAAAATGKTALFAANKILDTKSWVKPIVQKGVRMARNARNK